MLKFLKHRCFQSFILSGLTSLAATTAFAHDFWLAPNAHHIEKSGLVNVSVMIGHPSDRLTWPVDPHRIISLRSFGPNGIKDHQSSVADYSTSKALPISIEEPGLHILTIETTHSVSELNAEKFNSYIEEEGLTPIKIHRAVNQQTGDIGKEIYSRRGKTLIQLGNDGDLNPAYLAKPLGLTLEVVPLENPNGLKPGAPMTSKIYYRGAPIAGVTIGLINLDTNDGILAVSQSDNDGNVTFSRPPKGRWMLHAVWADPLEDTRVADYDTVFSSLSFEID